ncbi:MAG: antibiotic biosynthesis monooxygenase family protein [Candidatus Acidiferrales bacterium]
MFARKVSMQLKPGGAAEFKQKIESEIIPLLRKQKGFLDEITFLYPSGKEVHAFSLWETAEDAEAYNRAAYPEVTKVLASVVQGSPRVQTYEVLNCTFHKIAALAVSA